MEVLIERMKQLQECRDEEEASQEEMATRFEREKTESMLVATAGNQHVLTFLPFIQHSIPFLEFRLNSSTVL